MISSFIFPKKPSRQSCPEVIIKILTLSDMKFHPTIHKQGKDTVSNGCMTSINNAVVLYFI